MSTQYVAPEQDQTAKNPNAQINRLKGELQKKIIALLGLKEGLSLYRKCNDLSRVGKYFDILRVIAEWRYLYSNDNEESKSKMERLLRPVQRYCAKILLQGFNNLDQNTRKYLESCLDSKERMQTFNIKKIEKIRDTLKKNMNPSLLNVAVFWGLLALSVITAVLGFSVLNTQRELGIILPVIAILSALAVFSIAHYSSKKIYIPNECAYKALNKLFDQGIIYLCFVFDPPQKISLRPQPFIRLKKRPPEITVPSICNNYPVKNEQKTVYQFAKQNFDYNGAPVFLQLSSIREVAGNNNDPSISQSSDTKNRELSRWGFKPMPPIQEGQQESSLLQNRRNTI